MLKLWDKSKKDILTTKELLLRTCIGALQTGLRNQLIMFNFQGGLKYFTFALTWSIVSIAGLVLK